MWEYKEQEADVLRAFDSIIFSFALGNTATLSACDRAYLNDHIDTIAHNARPPHRPGEKGRFDHHRGLPQVLGTQPQSLLAPLHSLNSQN
jgi:hypothetical protein